MTEKYEKLEITSESFEPFVLCLVLGVIELMKSKVWSLDAGIWTIRRPIFFDKLAEMNMSQEILDVVDILDELSAIKEMSGNETAQVELNRIEKVIKRRLENFSENFWRAKWSVEI